MAASVVARSKAWTGLFVVIRGLKTKAKLLLHCGVGRTALCGLLEKAESLLRLALCQKKGSQVEIGLRILQGTGLLPLDGAAVGFDRCRGILRALQSKAQVVLDAEILRLQGEAVTEGLYRICGVVLAVLRSAEQVSGGLVAGRVLGDVVQPALGIGIVVELDVVGGDHEEVFRGWCLEARGFSVLGEGIAEFVFGDRGLAEQGPEFGFRALQVALRDLFANVSQSDSEPDRVPGRTSPFAHGAA